MNRPSMLKNLDAIMKQAAAGRQRKAAATGDLFGAVAMDDGLRLSEVPDWDEMTKLWHEQEVLGFPISGHPVALVRRESQHADDRLRDLANLVDIPAGRAVSLLGLVRDVWVKSSKGGHFAVVTLSDESGTGEVTFYSEAFDQYRQMLRVNAIILVRGKVHKKDQRSAIVVDSGRLVAEFGPRK